MKKWLVRLLAAFLLLSAALLYRPLTLESRQVRAEPAAGLRVDLDAAVDRFSRSVTFPTVSRGEGDADYAALAELRGFLGIRFPAVHEQLEREVVSEHSLLFTWPGLDPAARPVLLMGHLDVVPAGAHDEWTHPPFSGTVADGFVWGRGTMDDKVNVMAVLEAVEGLLGEGFKPARTVYLAFGHDEEIGGRDGAVRIAALLAERSIELELVLDEGMVIVEGGLPGVDVATALVGVAEKGYMSLELVARGEGGHSSMPPAETAVGILSRALVRLEENPMPAHMGLLREAFAYLAPEMPLGYRMLLGNLWLTEPLVKRMTLAEARSAATLRTTTAPTMLEGSVKDNVLPVEARAVVNFRIHPNDSVETVARAVERTVDDPRITVTQYGFASEPSAVSPLTGSGFTLLQRTIGEIFPEALVAPALVVGATDSRHYTALTPQIYRFTPMTIRAEDVVRVHGIDERLAVETYGRCIRFYAQLLRNLETL